GRQALAQKDGFFEPRQRVISGERRGEALETRDLLDCRQGRAVGDVVDRPRKGIEGRDMGTQSRRQQEGADREILGTGRLARWSFDGGYRGHLRGLPLLHASSPCS